MWVIFEVVHYDGWALWTEIVSRFHSEKFYPNPGWQPPYEWTVEPPEHVPRRKTYA